MQAIIVPFTRKVQLNARHHRTPEDRHRVRAVCDRLLAVDQRLLHAAHRRRAPHPASRERAPTRFHARGNVEESEWTVTTKLERAIEALTEISFLDTDPANQLTDAVKLAEQALRDIQKDKVLITVHAESNNKLTVKIASAAGNMELVKELYPRVQSLLNAIAIEEGNEPITWEPPSAPPTR